MAHFLGCGDDPVQQPPPADATPPGDVRNLQARVTAGGQVLLSWTSVGDDGEEGRASTYSLRYSSARLTEANWDSATTLSGAPAPQETGRLETWTIPSPGYGDWNYGLKVVDEVGNASGLSNVANLPIVDRTAPSRILDLSVQPGEIGEVQLAWTAPGNDGNVGTATEYDLRRSFDPITETNWGDAVRIKSAPTPRPAGTAEATVAADLDPNRNYYFAIRTADGAGNSSEISNVVNSTSSLITRLTSSPHSFGAFKPSFAPDGQQIVFNADWERWDSGNYYYQIYRLDLGAGPAVRLTAVPEGALFAKWSPDGLKVAFVSRRSVGRLPAADLAVVDPNGGSEPTVVYAAGALEVTGCAWSPDGAQLAFSLRDVTGSSPISSLHVVPSSGGTPVQLTSGPYPLLAMDWSPDGSTLAFSSLRDEKWDLWTIPAGGGVPVRLLDDGANNFGPAWSPDGSRIAYGSDRSGNYDVWTASASGENPVQITFDPWDQASPSWSPDGSKLVFEAFIENIGDIWMISSR